MTAAAPVHTVAPKLKVLDGRDETFVEHIVRSERTADKYKQLKKAEKDWAAAWKLTSKADPPDPSLSKSDYDEEQKKRDEKEYAKLLGIGRIPTPGIHAAVAKTLQTKEIKALNARAAAAKANVLTAQARDRVAAAAIQSRAQKQMRRLEKKASKATQAVKDAQIQHKHASHLAAKAVTAVHQQALLRQRKPVKVKVAPQTSTQKKSNSPISKEEDVIPRTVKHAMKEVGAKHGLKVAVVAPGATSTSQMQEKDEEKRRTIAALKVKAVAQSTSKLKKAIATGAAADAKP
jgi:hypothetical protein